MEVMNHDFKEMKETLAQAKGMLVNTGIVTEMGMC